MKIFLGDIAVSLLATPQRTRHVSGHDIGADFGNRSIIVAGLARDRRRAGKTTTYKPLSDAGWPASRLQDAGQALTRFASRLITTTGAGTT